MAAERVDVLVLGAGQAAKPLAVELAAAGRSVAVVEKAFVGGTCINVGCTPTKTMVASARVAYLARRGADYGVMTTGLSVDVAKVRARKRAIVEQFRSSGESKLEGTTGVSLVYGTARFTGPRTVDVDTRDGARRTLQADTIVINTGCRPAIPKLPGLDQVPFLDSTSIQELGEAPGHLVVLGGGYIGVELGQMFRRFGSAVTIVQRTPRLLARVDPDVADEVASILRADGIDLLLGHDAVRVEPAPRGVALVVRDAAGAEHRVLGTHLLVATGRAPNTDGLGCDAAGIALDPHGFIQIDDRLRTTADGVFAAGDVHGGPAFTHISYDDYRVLAKNLLHDGALSIAGRLVPWTVFMDPQLAHVGMSESDAAEQGRHVRVAKMPMSHVARALEMDESRGFMKAVVDPSTSEVLGFTVLGIEGGELMAVMQMAMMGGVKWPTLRDAVFSHPTLAESINNLFSLL